MSRMLHHRLLTRTRVLALALAGPALARGQIAPSAIDSKVAPVPPRVAAPRAPVPMDTSIRPGHLDLSAYTTPGRCLAATRHVIAQETRAADQVINTAVFDPLHRAQSAAAVAFAKAECGRAFSVANTPRDELPGLMELALVAGDDAKAAAAAERWLALKGSDTAMARRGWFLLDVMTTYLNAKPMRLAQAESLLARIDALGPEADPARFIGHTQLFNYISSRFDLTRLEREAMTLAALQGKVNDTTNPAMVYRWDHIPVVGLQQGQFGGPSDGADGVMFALLKAAAYQVSSPKEAKGVWEKVASALKQAKYWQSERDYAANAQFVGYFLEAMQSPYPTVRPAFWFGDAGPHAWPVPGKVNLAFDVGDMAERAENYPTFAMIRRLREKYGDKVAITLFTYTQGFRNDGPMAPAKEAEWLRAYWLDYLKLPVNLAVDTTAATKLPDGRVQRGPPAYRQLRVKGLPEPAPPAALVDQRGYMVLPFVGGEAAYDGFIKRLLELGGQ